MTAVDSFKHKTGQNLNMTIITVFPLNRNQPGDMKGFSVICTSAPKLIAEALGEFGYCV